jgi:hypothetical protein
MLIEAVIGLAVLGVVVYSLSGLFLGLNRQMSDVEGGSVSRDLVRLFNQLTETKELCAGLFVQNVNNGAAVTPYPARFRFDSNGAFVQSTANGLRVSAYPSESLRFSLTLSAYSDVKLVRASGATIRPGLIRLVPGEVPQVDSEFIKLEKDDKKDAGTGLRGVSELTFPVLFETKEIVGTGFEEVVSCFRSQKKIEYRTFQHTFIEGNSQNVQFSAQMQDDLVFQTGMNNVSSFELGCRLDLGWILASCDADAAAQFPANVTYRLSTAPLARSCLVNPTTLNKLRVVCAKGI